MPLLLLSDAVVENLKRIVACSTLINPVALDGEPSSSSPASSPSSSSSSSSKNSAELFGKIRHALENLRPIDHDQTCEKGGEKKLSASSPAVPPAPSEASGSDKEAQKTSEDKPGKTEGVVLHHDVLVELSNFARQLNSSQSGKSALEEAKLDATRYTLNSLVRGARFYYPPKPKFVRSPELEASLAKIRAQQEADEYARMAQPQPPSSGPSSSKLLSAFSIKPTFSSPPSSSSPATFAPPKWPTANANGIVPPVVPTERGDPSAPPIDESTAWAEMQQTLSAIINVLVSMGGVAFATWWAASASATLSIPNRTLLALFAALVVGVAESVLYIRSFQLAAQRKAKKAERMKGFEDGKQGVAVKSKSGFVDDETLKRLQEEQRKVWEKLDREQQEQGVEASESERKKDTKVVAPSEEQEGNSAAGSAVDANRTRVRKRKGQRKT